MEKVNILNRDMENILIRAFIYPVFQSRIEKNKESEIYNFFNFGSGWANKNIIENIEYSYKFWPVEDPEEEQLVKDVIDYYSSNNLFEEKKQKLFLILYGLKNYGNVFYEELKKHGLSNKISLKRVLEAIGSCILPDNINYNNDDIEQIISDKDSKIILSVLAVFLNKEYEIKAKRKQTSNIPKRTEAVDSTRDKTVSITTPTTEESEIPPLPEGLLSMASAMNIVNDPPLETEDDSKNSFSLILKDLIDKELEKKQKVTLSVDYFPLDILITALKEAGIEIEQGILPFKTTMTITQDGITIGDELINLNDKLSISGNAAEWWTHQLGHTLRKEYDLSSSNKLKM